MRNEIESRAIRKTSKTYRIARTSIFTALCVIGSFIRPPSPIQTVAFDSSPGFFAALYYGPLDGAIVTGIGHIVTSIINGFPLGVLHLPIALGMAIAGATIGAVNRSNYEWSFIPATVIGIGINTALFAIAVPAIGWIAAFSLIPFLALASSLNGAVAALVYISVRQRLRF